MKNIFYLIMFILLFACNNKSNISKNNIFEIPKEIFSSSKNILTDSFFNNIESIKLETRRDILIKNIHNIYFYANLFFIFHDQQISVFDKKGNFLKKIGKEGNGPGEYSFLPEGGAFYKEYIFLNDYYSKSILVYNIKGEYIKTIHTNYGISQLKVLNNKLLIAYIPNRTGNIPIKLYTYTFDGNKVDSLKNNLIYNDFFGSAKFSKECPLYQSSQNAIGFKEVFSDTLYIINSDLSLQPTSIIKLGDLQLKPGDIYNQKDIFKVLSHGKKILEILMDNENYVIFHDQDSRFTCIVWDKIKNSIDNIKFIYNPIIAKYFDKEKNFILIDPHDESSKVMTKDGTPYFMPQFVSEDNKYLISYETSATNEDDNPIIVLAEMK